MPGGGAIFNAAIVFDVAAFAGGIQPCPIGFLHSLGISTLPMTELDDLLSDDLIRFIPLTRGKIAVVDAWAYDAVMAAGPWRYTNNGYAKRDELLHRFILCLAGHDSLDFVDHWNGDKLDERISNLRPCTSSQNQANLGKQGSIGVYWYTPTRKWTARIKVQGTSLNLGYFMDKVEAARARDAKAFELFGHFARLNFPLQWFYETGGPPIVKRPPFDSLERPKRSRRGPRLLVSFPQ
jgi:hypothetical protein